jgi:C1A family cysteine protease
MSNSIKKGTGALLSPIDVRNYTATCAVNTGELPKEFSLDYLPEVKDQGRVGSCVAHALAFVVEYFDYLQGDNVGRMSTGYIYGNRSNNYTGTGRHLSVAIKDLMKYGVCPYSKFPENVEVPEAIRLVESRLYNLYPEAYPNRISSYYQLHNTADIKAALMSGSPVVFAIYWYDDYELTNGNVLRFLTNTYDSSHAMVIYGWNETGWLIQNSWGDDWGDGGRAILPYGYSLKEAWGFTDTHSEAQKKAKEQEYIDQILLLQEQLTFKTNEIFRLSKDINHLNIQLSEQRDTIARLEGEVSSTEQERAMLESKH